MPAGRLLLIEDEQLLRSLLTQFLRAAGYEVVEAADGLAGVNQFLAGRPFDLILLDMNLPELHGVEVARRILAAQPDQKILVCSACVVSEHAEALIELGVANQLTKPYHPAELLARIAAFTRSKAVEPLDSKVQVAYDTPREELSSPPHGPSHVAGVLSSRLIEPNTRRI